VVCVCVCDACTVQDGVDGDGEGRVGVQGAGVAESDVDLFGSVDLTDHHDQQLQRHEAAQLVANAERQIVEHVPNTYHKHTYGSRATELYVEFSDPS